MEVLAVLWTELSRKFGGITKLDFDVHINIGLDTAWVVTDIYTYS